MNSPDGVKILQRVERHVVNKNDINYKAIDTLCGKSKNLYNYVNYIIRQSFIADSTIPEEYELTKQLRDKHDEVYYDMCGNTNQCCIKLLYKNWKSFFRAIKDYSKNPSKYLGRPKLPGYKDKNSKNIVIFTYSDSRIKNGYLYVNHKSGIGPIKTAVTNEQFKQVRFVPQSSCYIIEIVYETNQVDLNLNKENYLSIDLGIDNFATCYDSHANIAFIINGKIIKSMNQYYNKKKSILMSYIGDKGTSNRLKQLDLKRYNKINDYMHNTSRRIIDYCIGHNIGTIVVGHNKGWKQETNIGKTNNQKFVSIPYDKFIQQLQYKGEDVNIQVIVIEESYTSKIDHLALEPMQKQDNYMGKRIHRGLFKSSTGKVVNADLNGAVGILRKVIDEPQFVEIINRGFVTNPVKVNPLAKIFI